MRKAPFIELTEREKRELTKLVNGRRSEVRVVVRASVVLAAARGLDNKSIAAELGIQAATVGRWRHRYAESGIHGIIKDLPRGGCEFGSGQLTRLD